MTERGPRALVVATFVLSIVVVLAAVAALAAGSASAAPPPEELCGVCGDGLPSVAQEAGVPLSVERAALTVTVRQNGSSHWHARVRIDAESAEVLAGDDARRERIVRRTYSDGRTVVDAPRGLATRVENDTLVVDFDVPGVARPGPEGTYLVTFLERTGRQSAIELDADRVTMRGPEGTVVTRGVPGTTVRDGTVTWDQSSDGDAEYLDRQTLLVFAPKGGLYGSVATWMALLRDAGRSLGAIAVAASTVPMLALGAAVSALFPSGGRSHAVDSWATPRRVGTAVLVGGAAVGALAFGAVRDGWVPPAVFAAAALSPFFGAAAIRDARPSKWRVALWTLVALGVAAVAAVLVSEGGPGELLTVFVVPVALFFAAGYADPGDPRSTTLVVGALLALPVVFAAGFWILVVAGASTLTGVVLVGWAVAALLLGLPLLALGHTLAGPSGTRS